MSEPLRFGVLGCASIAVRKVIPAIARSQRCEVVAIASRDAGRASAAATDLGIARHHGSYDELLADPGVEAVYIPLPNHLHAAWTLRAAEAGKHVLCEKPLALDTTEAAGMIEGCRRAGVVLMEAFMYRVHPLWTRTYELVNAGSIGELQAIQAFFSYRNLDPENIRNIAEYGGGALMDIGCYPINVARWLFAEEPSDVVDAGSNQTDAARGVRPEAANRGAHQHVAHQGRDVAVADQIERSIVGTDPEEVRGVAEVHLEPDRAVAHPAERCTVVDLAFELVAEILADAADVGTPTERRADKRRQQPIGRRLCRGSRRRNESYRSRDQ